ncbi:MAG: hypothetical protein Q7U74_06135, partial [Saprospiraceae bacterium]|nr:hypothetical protein [Saprospiraceae bacterium]
QQEARKILTYWMRTFGTRKDKGGTMGQVKQAKFNLADAVNQAADRIMSLREDAQASRAQVIAAIYKYLGAEFEKDITDPVAFCQLADAVIEFVNPK